MIRVLVHGVSSNLGGLERYILQLARSLDPSEFHLDITHTDTPETPALHDELAALGSDFYPVTPRRSNARRNRRDLATLMGSRHFDLLYFNAMSASYLAPVRAALNAGMPTVVHSHSAGGPPSHRTRMLHRVGRLSPALTQSRRIAVSDPAGRWMFGRRSWEVVQNGIDLDEFSFDLIGRERLRRELGLTDHLVIGHIGAFLPAKNHSFLLDVFEHVRRDRSDALLLLVGEGPHKDPCSTRAQNMGLDAQIRFVGQRTDIRDLLSAMDLFVFPSTYEGSPLSVVEARAAGLPVLVSDAVPADLSDGSTMRLPLTAGPAEWAKATLSRSLRRQPLTLGVPSVREHALAMADIFRQTARSA